MKFIDYLYDTDGCLCDRLYNYDDIQLQAVFALPTTNPSQAYRLNFFIGAYTLDGQFIADVSEDFKKSFYKIPGTTNGYSNIVSIRIPEVLCTHKCFRLKVTIKATYSVNSLANTRVVFDMFTDCMTVDSCCVRIPKGGIRFETIQPGALPDVNFDVDENMMLAYTDETGTSGLDFDLSSSGVLTVTGESKVIEPANFNITEGNLTATDYE